MMPPLVKEDKTKQRKEPPDV